MIKKAVYVLVLAGLCLTIFQTQRALDKHKTIHFVNKQAIFLPRGETLKWLSMGYRGMVADWLWINSVLYFGRRIIHHDNPYFMYAYNEGTLDDDIKRRHDAHGHSHHLHHKHGATEQQEIRPGSHNAEAIPDRLEHILYNFESRGLLIYLYPMLERVTTVDPHFVFPYIFGGIYVLMSTGEIDEAQKLLEKGKKANPDRWEFPLYLGWLHWMYRHDIPTTHQYLLEAVSLEGCPPYVPNLLQGLSKDLKKENFTILYLKSIAESTENEEIRERLLEILSELESSQ